MKKALEKKLEPKLASIEKWIMDGPGMRKRAFMAIVPPLTIGLCLLVFSSKSTDYAGWPIVGLLISYVAANTFVNVRSLARAKPLPVCDCRRDSLGIIVPFGILRYLRLAVSLLFFAAAYGSMLYATTTLTLFCTWVAVSYLIAYRKGYPGQPEVGAIMSSVTGHKISTGCGPWCVIDHKLLGIDRRKI